MRKDIQDHVEDLIRKFAETWNHEDADLQRDPVMKLLTSAIVYETLDIREQIKKSNQETATFFRDLLLPAHLISARPALGILQVRLNKKIDAPVAVTGKMEFLYEKKTGSKEKNNEKKAEYNFIPLIETHLIPAEVKYQLQDNKLFSFIDGARHPIQKTKHTDDCGVWIGLKAEAGLQSLHRATLFFDFQARSSKTTYPLKVSLQVNDVKRTLLPVSEVNRNQYTSGFNERHSADALCGEIDAFGIDNFLPLYYIEEAENEAPLEPIRYPGKFEALFSKDEREKLFTENLLWLYVDIHSLPGHLPAKEFNVLINCFPVVNAEAQTLFLNPATPIERIPKNPEKQFLSLISDAKEENAAYMIRNFSVERFNPEELRRQVQQLYNRFTTDYFAFKGSLSEGKELNELNKAMSEVYNHLQESKWTAFSGYYAVLKPKADTPGTAVSYLSTDGKAANRIAKGEKLGIRKNLPYVEPLAVLVTETFGGKDEATEKERQVLSRYHILTGNRLVSKEDLRAFCHKELGSELQSVQVVNGAVATPNGLSRGIILDIRLTPRPVPDEAYNEIIAHSLRIKIESLSAFVFPLEIRVS